jgi:hypothetical protein
MDYVRFACHQQKPEENQETASGYLIVGYWQKEFTSDILLYKKQSINN